MVLAVVAVLVGVFFAATGRGGELSREPVDYAPLELGSVSAADVALLRPPTALWGYNVDVTDEALDRIARAVRDRDLTIAYLQEQLAARDTGSVSATAPTPATPAAPPTLPEPQALPRQLGPADLAGEEEDGPGQVGEGADQEQGW
jgi:hypothetical protein